MDEAWRQLRLSPFHVLVNCNWLCGFGIYSLLKSHFKHNLSTLRYRRQLDYLSDSRRLSIVTRKLAEAASVASVLVLSVGIWFARPRYGDVPFSRKDLECVLQTYGEEGFVERAWIHGISLSMHTMYLTWVRQWGGRRVHYWLGLNCFSIPSARENTMKHPWKDIAGRMFEQADMSCM